MGASRGCGDCYCISMHSARMWLIIGRFCFWATLWTGGAGAGAGGSATSPDPLAIETSEIPADSWQPRRSRTEHQVQILYRNTREKVFVGKLYGCNREVL